MTPLAALVLASAAFLADDRLARIEKSELEATRTLATALYEAGENYYRGGYRKEAIHFLKRCLEIRPDNRPITRLVGLLQDHDNPIWRKKRWRSPKASVDAGFRSRAAALDQRLIAARVKMGHTSFKEKDPALLRRGLDHLRRALELAGGPYVVDDAGRIDLQAARIDAEPTAALLESDLIRINGELWLRDAMLASLPDAAEVHEVRGTHCVVRTIGDDPLNAELAKLLDAAWTCYVRDTAQEPARPLFLLVLPDRSSYEAFCDRVTRPEHRLAAGFADARRGYAVTFVQSGVQRIAIHEGAHAFHFLAFGTDMPSWYDEGFAETFGGEDTWRLEGETLVTGLPLAHARLTELATAGVLPFAEFLRAEASGTFTRGEAATRLFYTQSWALFTFLQATTDARFRERFDEWESFALGSGWDAEAPGARAEDAARLFDQVFEPVIRDLERAFSEWVQVEAAR